jgi:predicted nucleic acid-binding protein
LDVTKVFLDTNILVYAVDGSDAVKQERAIKALQVCIDDGSGVISTQVLQEFAAVALGKLHQEVEVILAELSVLGSMQIVQVTPALIRRALELHALHRIHYWDATILAAAEAARCTRLWSEDFAPGSILGLIHIENPLLERADI